MQTSGRRVYLSLIIVVALSLIAPIIMAECTREAKVYIIYTEKPTNEESKDYHLRTLSTALGSEEAAKDALIYSYKDGASGFSAKLTSEQAAKISKQPGVIRVVPSESSELHKPIATSEAKVYIIYTEKANNEEPKDYHLRTLSTALGSEKAAKDALIYSYKDGASGFSAKLTPGQAAKISKQPGVIRVVPSESSELHKPIGGDSKLP